MTVKETIVKETVNFYVDSNDFNGIPLWKLEKSMGGKNESFDGALTELISDGSVALNYTINPNIKQFKDFPIEEQISKYNEGDLYSIYVYPTEKTLKSRVKSKKYDSKPFSKMLLYGKPQLEFVFFEIQILEDYFKDPRYHVYFTDYSGSIGYNNENDLEERDQILLDTFGIGYKAEDRNKERVVAVYLRYLSNLTPEHQQRWYTRLIYEKCFVAKEYYQNTILGEWAEYGSIYDAFIEELYHINEMSERMFGKKLFLKTYKDERPDDFKLIFIPTLDNYNNFIHLLDKMMSDNINKDFFKGMIPLESETLRNDGKIVVQNKGTIQLFEEWLKKNFRFCNVEGSDLIFKPFRYIRKLRQKPAHAVSSNKYDKSLFMKQDELIKSAYEAISSIRLIFANHPKVISYEIPEWLCDGKIKIF